MGRGMPPGPPLVRAVTNLLTAMQVNQRKLHLAPVLVASA